jgi:hypothetical protein
VVVTLIMLQKYPPDVMEKKKAQMEYVRQRRQVHPVLESSAIYLCLYI